MAFTVFLSVLAAGCGIKWATNKVLSNPDAIAKVGAVYDVLTPRDTTERLVFIQGDSVIIESIDTAYLYKNDTLSGKDTLTMDKTDAIYIKGGLMSERNDKTDTIRITTVRNFRRVDTIKWQLPPDNRLINRLNDSVIHYKAITARLSGKEDNYKAQIKTAEKRLIWMAAGVLVLGVVIGLLLRLKVKL
jgi:hypothetical protein